MNTGLIIHLSNILPCLHIHSVSLQLDLDQIFPLPRSLKGKWPQKHCISTLFGIYQRQWTVQWFICYAFAFCLNTSSCQHVEYWAFSADLISSGLEAKKKEKEKCGKQFILMLFFNERVKTDFHLSIEVNLSSIWISKIKWDLHLTEEMCLVKTKIIGI